jgi:hypothetical protein
MPNGVQERGKQLEQAFFLEQHEEQRALLRLRQEELDAREALAEASGIDDPELLARLAGLGIRVETLAALTLIPLVEVAWADGSMAPREREAILRGSEACAIAKGSPSYKLLEIWTRDRPAPELADSWRAFMRALSAELGDDERRHLEERILGRARAVAEAAGGILGLDDPVSPEEEAVLAKLAAAFGAAATRLT